MKNFLLILFLIFTSCSSTYYQVYKVAPTFKYQTNDNYIIFENEDCKVSYNFWNDKGNPGFKFYNKTDKNIYLHLDESFFVLNQKSHNYYKNRVFTNVTNNIINIPSSSISYVEEKIVCIPSKTYKIFEEYHINDSIYRSCDFLLYPRNKDVKNKIFTKENSPFVFNNVISYNIGESINLIKFVNEFYVTEIINYKEEEIIKKEMYSYCGEKGLKTISYFTVNSCDKYYIKYFKVDFLKH